MGVLRVTVEQIEEMHALLPSTTRIGSYLSGGLRYMADLRAAPEFAPAWTSMAALDYIEPAPDRDDG